MAAVTITLKPFEPMEADLQGFHGKGCSEIADMLAELGETVQRDKKPEYHQLRVGAGAQQRQQHHVGGTDPRRQ